MTEKEFDAEAFRTFEHEGWNRIHAGYHNHWEHLTTQAIPPLLDAARIGDGMAVLDVASGPGYVSNAAAARGAITRGIDISEKMTELSSQTFPELHFQVGDAEALPFDDETFDAVLINFGVLHFPEVDTALAEAYRVLKPSGRLGFTTWAGPQGSALGIAADAVAQHGSVDVDLTPGTPRFRFADHAECENVLRELGFRQIKCIDLMLTWRVQRLDQLLSSFQQATPRTGALLLAQDPEALPAIQAAMTEACRPYIKGDYAALPMPAVLTCADKA